jgi:hypothetical protein
MNTPIIANLIPRLREHAAAHLLAYLEKGGELSPILESIEFWWDGIRDRDFPELPMWSDLPAPDRDALFDAWIEAVEDWFSARRVSSHPDVLSRSARSGGVGKPGGPSNASGSGAPSAGTDVLGAKLHEALNALREGLEHVSLRFEGNTTNPGNLGTAIRKIGQGMGLIAALAADQSLPVSVAPAASCASPAPLVPEVVKEALEGSVCEVEPLGEMEATTRGFEIIHFEDRNGEACSLQQSSLADYEPPGSSAVWLGTDRRMHLTISQVEKLVAHLQAWVETGSFRLVPRGGAADQP